MFGASMASWNRWYSGIEAKRNFANKNSSEWDYFYERLHVPEFASLVMLNSGTRPNIRLQKKNYTFKAPARTSCRVTKILYLKIRTDFVNSVSANYSMIYVIGIFNTPLLLEAHNCTSRTHETHHWDHNCKLTSTTNIDVLLGTCVSVWALLSASRRAPDDFDWPHYWRRNSQCSRSSGSSFGSQIDSDYCHWECPRSPRIWQLLRCSGVSETKVILKNAVFWDVTPCGSCKNRRFGGT
jgi:hypothetical protein